MARTSKELFDSKGMEDAVIDIDKDGIEEEMDANEPESDEEIDENEIMQEKIVPAEEENEVEEANEAAEAVAHSGQKRTRRQVKGLPEEVTSGDAINRAGRKSKKNLYKEEDIYTIEKGKRVDSEAEQRKKTWLELVQSARTNTILEGRLDSCKKTKNGVVLAVVTYKDATVYIPSKYLFQFNSANVQWNENSPISKETAITNALTYFTNLRMGMPVKFIVKQAYERDENNPEGGAVAYGSRVAAMEQESYAYYKDKGQDGMPELMEGLRAEAVVTYLSRNGVGVNVFGADAFIPVSELSWNRIGDVRTDSANFHVGQVINVKINKVEGAVYKPEGSSDSFNLINVSVSAKEAQSNPNKKWYNFFQVDQTCLAEVKQITEDGIFVFLSNKRDCLCEFPSNLQIPPIGSLVNVKIVRKVDENYFIYGSIRKILRMGEAE